MTLPLRKLVQSEGLAVFGVRAGFFGAAVSILFLGCAPKSLVPPPTVTVEQQSILARSSPVLDAKCSRCHDLGRVYAVVGSGGDWVRTVVVMSSKEEGWISPQEMESLAACTFEKAETQPGKENPAPPDNLLPPRAVLENKCSHCHDLGRVYAAIDDPLQWVKTVVTMRAKDPEWLSGEEIKVIIRYRQRHPDYVQRLFKDSCGSCHYWDELRSMKKTASQWRTTIHYMARRCNEEMQSHELEATYYALAGP